MGLFDKFMDVMRLSPDDEDDFYDDDYYDDEEETAEASSKQNHSDAHIETAEWQ